MDDKQRMQTFFQSTFKQHGEAIGSLGWGSEASQKGRFEILTQIASLNGKSVLDVGCGFGDLSEYLSSRGINASYHGIDLTREMVETARSRYPNATFDLVSLSDFATDAKFDFVLSSGIHFMKSRDNLAEIGANLRKMFSLARNGVASNFLSSYHDGAPAPDSYYARPEDVFSLSMKITPKVTLRHDYRKNDFTVYLYK